MWEGGGRWLTGREEGEQGGGEARKGRSNERERRREGEGSTLRQPTRGSPFAPSQLYFTLYDVDTAANLEFAEACQVAHPMQHMRCHHAPHEAPCRHAPHAMHHITPCPRKRRSSSSSAISSGTS